MFQDAAYKGPATVLGMRSEVGVFDAAAVVEDVSHDPFPWFGEEIDELPVIVRKDRGGTSDDEEKRGEHGVHSY